MLKNSIGILFWVGFCLFAGLVGSQFEPGEWYESLNKSSLTPPNIVFPIVWNILFVLMGISVWLVWKSKLGKSKIIAITIFITQLIFNIFWSYLFFGINRPDLALIEIITLWLLILITFIIFYRVSRLSGVLITPYLLWVTFAIYLNYSIVSLNNI